MKVDRQNQQLNVPPGAFEVSDRLFESFRSYIAADKTYGLSVEAMNANID